MAKEYVLECGHVVRPTIKKLYNAPGLSWREVKKQLRQYYLNEAAALRTIKEKDYFNHD